MGEYSCVCEFDFLVRSSISAGLKVDDEKLNQIIIREANTPNRVCPEYTLEVRSSSCKICMLPKVNLTRLNPTHSSTEGGIEIIRYACVREGRKRLLTDSAGSNGTPVEPSRDRGIMGCFGRWWCAFVFYFRCHVRPSGTLRPS